MKDHKVTIIINQHSYHFEEPTLTPEELRNAVGAPADYEIWQIIKDPDPEGQLPKDDVQVTAPITVENGWKFRVVPTGTFGCLL